MCILKECADPTSPGIWWRDDAEWKRYDEAQFEVIREAISKGLRRVELGKLVSTVHAHGEHYVVDLPRMEQINIRSGHTRSIKVVDDPAPVMTAGSVLTSDTLLRNARTLSYDVQESCGHPMSAGVWWRDDAGWKRYGDAHEKFIRAAIAEGLESIDLGKVRSVVHAQGAYYVVNLRELKQVNVQTGHIRRIKVTDDPATEVTSAQGLLLKELEGTVQKLKSQVKALKSKLLQDALKSFAMSAALESLLAE